MRPVFDPSTVHRFKHRGAVDADGHLLEDAGLWDRYIEAKFRDRAPRTEMRASGAGGFEGEFWVAPHSANAEPRPVATYWGAGLSMAEAKEMNKKGYAAAPDFVFDPKARLAAQDRDAAIAAWREAYCGWRPPSSPVSRSCGMRSPCWTRVRSRL